MKVLRIENSTKGHPEYFTIWVLAKHNLIDWQDCPFAFKYKDGLIHHTVGNQDVKLVGEAGSKDDAVEKAKIYLEKWLRECGAID